MHPDDCYHCGRPENTEPFVIDGTPVELYSSETDAGRWRHWGGADLWLCRVHRYHVGEDPPEGNDVPSRYRLMEVFEAAEHAILHRHNLAEEPRAVQVPLQAQALADFQSANGERLQNLDLLAPTVVTLGIRLKRALIRISTDNESSRQPGVLRRRDAKKRTVASPLVTFTNTEPRRRHLPVQINELRRASPRQGQWPEWAVRESSA